MGGRSPWGPLMPRPLWALVTQFACAPAWNLSGRRRESRRKRNGDGATDRQHHHQQQPEIVQPPVAPTSLHRKTPVRSPGALATGDLP